MFAAAHLLTQDGHRHVDPRNALRLSPEALDGPWCRPLGAVNAPVAALCLNLLGGLIVVLGAKLLEVQSRKVVIELDVAD
jgi:hypothetical protein